MTPHDVVDWLNDPRGSDVNSVSELVGLMDADEAAGRRRITKLLSELQPITQNLERAWEERGSLSRVIRLLRIYRLFPRPNLVWRDNSVRFTYELRPISDVPQNVPMPEPLRDENGEAIVPTTTELATLQLILDMAANGTLDYLKKCDCGKWMLRRKSDQRYCSQQCRFQQTRTSEIFKARRRKKAREYYRLHKSGKVK